MTTTHSFQLLQLLSKPFLSLVSFSYFTVPSPSPCQVIFPVVAMLRPLLVHPCRTIPNGITQNVPMDRAHVVIHSPREMQHLLDTPFVHYSCAVSHQIKLGFGLFMTQNYYSQLDSQNVPKVCKMLFPHTRRKN